MVETELHFPKPLHNHFRVSATTHTHTHTHTHTQTHAINACAVNHRTLTGLTRTKGLEDFSRRERKREFPLCSVEMNLTSIHEDTG